MKINIKYFKGCRLSTTQMGALVIISKVHHKQKERKRKFDTQNIVKMCHIQRNTISILNIPHVYLDLAPPCQKKSEIG